MFEMCTPPDLIIYNAAVAPILPLKGTSGRDLRAVAVRRHRIQALGSDAEVLALAGSQTRRIDAAGGTLLPGLADSHIHFAAWAQTLSALQIADTVSQAEMLERLAGRASGTVPGRWIVARGWNESRWRSGRFPTATELDAVTGPDRPALLYRSDMHSAVANSAALAAAGIDASRSAPPFGVIDRNADGTPTGVLREAAIDLVADLVPAPRESEQLDALRQGMATMHRYGITSVHDQRVWSGDEGPRALRHFQLLRAERELLLRVACNVAAHDLEHASGAGLRSGFGDDFLRLGHVKLFADGSLGSRTAWMLEPFVPSFPGEPPNTGMVVTSPDEMRDWFARSVAAGFPVSIHAIGDRANREVLDAFAEVAQSQPAPIHLAAPHRIEHVQMIDPVDALRLAAQNLTASVQPMHALDDIEVADALLGSRAATAYSFRTLLQAGTRLAFGSDAPVATPDPWLGLHAAVVRGRPGGVPWQPQERIPLDAALRAYTHQAAEAAGWSDRFGHLAPGMRADMALLDRDLFALTDEDLAAGALAKCPVQLTVFDGAIVYEA